jgi:hypothetical protein
MKPKIRWEEPSEKGLLGSPLLFDGTPYVMKSSVIMECQFGRDHHVARRAKKKKTNKVGSFVFLCIVVNSRICKI